MRKKPGSVRSAALDSSERMRVTPAAPSWLCQPVPDRPPAGITDGTWSWRAVRSLGRVRTARASFPRLSACARRRRGAWARTSTWTWAFTSGQATRTRAPDHVIRAVPSVGTGHGLHVAEQDALTGPRGASQHYHRAHPQPGFVERYRQPTALPLPPEQLIRRSAPWHSPLIT